MKKSVKLSCKKNNEKSCGKALFSSFVSLQHLKAVREEEPWGWTEFVSEEGLIPLKGPF